ncbi:MAG: hypothetical protein H0U55_10055 [Rubrobacteraceae bacterium]|nr:hypothetical protein [Rubrobacteraceae bacterium]
MFEGVVLAAQREAEEKKVRLYGNLLANLAFAQDHDRSQANFLIRLGEDLSYRQLCLLSLFAGNTLLSDADNSSDADNPLGLRERDYSDHVGKVNNPDLLMLLQETYDLYQRGIVSSGTYVMLSPATANPSQISPVGAAWSLYFLMELREVSKDDLAVLMELLS